MAQKPQSKTAQKRPVWQTRPPDSPTTFIAEWRLRGPYAAWALRRAKKAFARNEAKTLHKIAMKLHQKMDDKDILTLLYQHASSRGKYPHLPMSYALGTLILRLRKYKELQNYMRGWVNDRALTIFKAGEKAGKRPEAIEEYLWTSRKTKEYKTALSQGLKKPLTNCLIVVAYMIVIARYITPAYNQAVDRQYWTGVLKLVAFVSDIVNVYLPYLIGFGIIFAIICTMSIQRCLGPLRLKLEEISFIPVWKIYKQLVGVSFLTTFAALKRTSIGDNEILMILRQEAGPYYRSRIDAAIAYTSEGMEITPALDATGLNFPDRYIITDLLSLSGSKSFSDEITTITSEWIDDSIERLKTTVSVIDTFVMLLSYGLMALITMADFAFVQLLQKHMQ